MDPDRSRDSRAVWQRTGCLWSIGASAAILVVFGALLRASRGRGRVLDLGLKAVGVVAILAAVVAGARALAKARGRGPTLRETAVALLGMAGFLVFLWFVMMYGF
jgi:hypothetical protein